ncbi:MAG: hypothetical protein DWQ02_15730 [Bacteroidetes bacterium]|nr:MAG: hypothetical protein DWQ02_15730 [Bacteroidota bacterium]
MIEKFRKTGSSLHSPYFFAIFATVLHQKRFIKGNGPKKGNYLKVFQNLFTTDSAGYFFLFRRTS